MRAQPSVFMLNMDDATTDVLQRMPYLATDPFGSWVDLPYIYAPHSLCAPSRVALHTGRYPHRHSCWDNHPPIDYAPEAARIGARMQDAGYKTFFAGKYVNKYPWIGEGGSATYIPAGWDEWRYGNGYYGFNAIERPEGGVVSAFQHPPEDYTTDVHAGMTADWITAQPPGQPWFAYWAPHAPHRDPAEGVAVPADRHAGLYPSESTPVPHGPAWNEARWVNKPYWMRSVNPWPLEQAELDAEDEFQRSAWRTTMAVDEGLQLVLDAIDARGEMGDTIVIVTVDNSVGNNEHRGRIKNRILEKSANLYTRVRWPGAAVSSLDTLTTNMDFMPTLLDMAGGTALLPPDGVSLRPLFEGTATKVRDRLMMRRGNAGQNPNSVGYGLVDAEAGWWYVETYDNGNSRELYRWPDDLEQLDNRANLRPYARIQAGMVAQLTALKVAYDATDGD